MNTIPSVSIAEASRASTAIALVSGKGGSGKTMLAVALAQGAALAGKSVVLIDTDFATAGLTYYLTFRAFSKAKFGLSDLISKPDAVSNMTSWAGVGNPQAGDERWLDEVRLVPIGDHRIPVDEVSEGMMSAFRKALEEAKRIADIVIVDCRGGIDNQSIAVSMMVDEVLVVVETDTTSVRASQHLADEFLSFGIKDKIAGFVLNKVLDDPTSLAMTASSLLRVDYLGAIPFDIDATRSYIQGKVPDSSSLFSRHCFAVISKLIPGITLYDRLRTLSPADFSSVTLKSPETRLGGVMIAAFSMYISVGLLAVAYAKASDGVVKYLPGIAAYGLICNVLVLAAVSDPIKQVIGGIFRSYNRVFSTALKKIYR